MLGNTPTPPRPRARLHVFFTEQSYRSRWKQKVGVRQIGEQSYGFATVARRRTGRERLLGEGEALYGCLGAGMTTLVRAGGARSGKPIPTAVAARCQAEARCAYDQSRNVVLFQGDRARDSTFDQGFRW